MNIILNTQLQTTTSSLHWHGTSRFQGYPVSWDIPHRDRIEAHGAWKFARTRGTPLNMHVLCPVPPSFGPLDNLMFCRAFAHKLRMYCRANFYECVMIWSRRSDVARSSYETIEVLIHVPDTLQSNFTKVVQGWLRGVVVSPSDYVETWSPAGTKLSAFNDLFRAASNQTLSSDPTATYEKSGAVLGERTFVSRKLWTKARIAHGIGLGAGGGTGGRSAPTTPTQIIPAAQAGVP